MRALAIALLLLAATMPFAAAEPICAGDAIPIVRGSACVSAGDAVTFEAWHVDRAGAASSCAATVGATGAPAAHRCGADRCVNEVQPDGSVVRRCDAEAASEGACSVATDKELLDLVEMEIREGTASCGGGASGGAGDAHASGVVRKKPGRTTYANIVLERAGNTSSSNDCDGTSDFRKLLDQGEAGDNVALRCAATGDLDGDGYPEVVSSSACRGGKKEEVERGQVLACPGHKRVVVAGCGLFVGFPEHGIPSARTCLA